MTMAGALEVGCVFVNARVSSTPHLPFGGTKRSGYGRELGSFGIRELTNVKAVAVMLAPEDRPWDGLR
jgi:succinate-semialdehyde dehydrogenase/glutarate-semialdehyde dehydrogenase